MTPPADDFPRVTLFDVAQVAVILNKGERFVRDEVRKKHMPHVRIGGSIRFTEQNLRDYIDSSTQAAAPRNPMGRVTRRKQVK